MFSAVVLAGGSGPVLDKAIRAGEVDLLMMHSGDITTDIVGPTNDPAQIRGMTNGALALKKIAEVQAKFVDFEGIGGRELTHTLWRQAGVEPKGDWVIKDDPAISKWNVLQFCRSNHAYVVVGYIPALTGKMQNDGTEILVKNDPVMRRPYIAWRRIRKYFRTPTSRARGRCRISCLDSAVTVSAIIHCFFARTPPNFDRNKNETHSNFLVCRCDDLFHGAR